MKFQKISDGTNQEIKRTNFLCFPYSFSMILKKLIEIQPYFPLFFTLKRTTFAPRFETHISKPGCGEIGRHVRLRI